MRANKILLSVLSVGLLCCNPKPRSEPQSENSFLTDTISQNMNDAIFFDKGVSSFRILSMDKMNGYEFETVETNYKVHFIIPDGHKQLGHHIAKYTTTTIVNLGQEGQNRNMKIELYAFENPSKLVMKVDKNCDKLDILTDTYLTTIYGCCGAEDSYEIFDFKHKSIIQSDNKIIIGEVPNPRIRFYVGFRPDFADTLNLGYLNFSYNSDEKYTIKIRTRRNLLKNDFLPFSPDIEILSSENDRKYSESVFVKYTFWSLNNKIRDKNSIDNLVIRLSFPSENEVINNVVEIPIINGKPYGKDEKVQEIYLTE